MLPSTAYDKTTGTSFDVKLTLPTICWNYCCFLYCLLALHTGHVLYIAKDDNQLISSVDCAAQDIYVRCY